MLVLPKVPKNFFLLSLSNPRTLKPFLTKNSDILVNTSFNISKDPIVFDLYDVFVNMKRMKIEFVIMDDGLYQIKDL